VNITESRLGEVTMLGLEGRLDSVSAPELERKIKALTDAGSVRIALDCARLEYVSSAGLRVFLGAAKRLKTAQGRFALGAAVEQVREILDMAGFASVLPVLKTAQDAASACAS
jgi:anti-sigma B factor antagonist